MSFVLHGGQGKSLFVTRTGIRIVQEDQLERRDKVLLLRHVSAVEVKKPGAFDGYVQFTIAGGLPHDSSKSFTGGAFGAARDENSVTFADAESYDLALKIKVHIESWTPGDTISIADEVAKLHALVERGTLSADEFAAAKRHLVGG